MRLATAVAGGLATAAAVMAVLAFTTGDDGDKQPAAAVSSTTVATPAAGLAVFVAQGCGSCHTLAAANAHAEIGPDLASTLQGKSAAYIRKSIVAPNADTAPGYSTGTMPEDYASRMTPAELDRLVGFLQNARGPGS